MNSLISRTKKIVCRIIFISFFLSCFSCKDTNSSLLTLDLWKIESDKLRKMDGISYLAKDIQFIPLQEDSCSLLRSVEKMEASGDFLFISDGERLFQFDKQGVLVRQIGSKGKGPQEFLCYDFDLDTVLNTVYIFDYYQGRVMKYGYDGKYIGMYAIPIKIDGVNASHSINYMRCLGDGKLIFAANINSKQAETHFYDENTQKVITLEKNSQQSAEGSIMMGANRIFYTYKGELFGKHLFSEIVNKYTPNGEVVPAYRIKTGKLSLKPADLNSFENLPRPQSIIIQNIVEGPYFIMVFYRYFIDKKNYKEYLAYYDKTNPFDYESLFRCFFFVDKMIDFDKNNFDEHGALKKKDSWIDGSSAMILAKDGNLYQVRSVDQISKEQKIKMGLNDEFSNPVIVRYVLNAKYEGYE